jgi:hypothetical protein
MYYRCPHIAPRGAARAREIHSLQLLYSIAPCGAPHTTPADPEISIHFFFGPCGALPCVCMRLQNSQNTKCAGSVFGLLSPFLGVFIFKTCTFGQPELFDPKLMQLIFDSGVEDRISA